MKYSTTPPRPSHGNFRPRKQPRPNPSQKSAPFSCRFFNTWTSRTQKTQVDHDPDDITPILHHIHRNHQETPSLRLIRNSRTREALAAFPSSVAVKTPFPKSSSSPCSHESPCSPNRGGPKKPSTLLRRCSKVIKASPLGFNIA